MDRTTSRGFNFKIETPLAIPICRTGNCKMSTNCTNLVKIVGWGEKLIIGLDSFKKLPIMYNSRTFMTCSAGQEKCL